MNLINAIFPSLDDLSEQLVWLQRRETWAGDVKANFIRMVALVIFTINEIFNYYLLHAVDKRFHIGSLIIISLWVIASINFHILLRRHWLPRATPYLMPSVDIFLVTWLILLGDGPKSPLVGIYFLIIALAALRLYPAAVLYTSCASAIGYLATWIFVKHQKPIFAVPHFHVVITILCLLFMGIILAHGLTRVYVLLSEMRKER